MEALRKEDESGKQRVLIIGSGISGILAGISLKKRGIDSFTILEKAATLGGTWRDNTYPGLTCDAPAHLYVYSFAPKPDWTKTFPTGPEIWRYYAETARRYGVDSRIQYNKRVVSARWNGARWIITTADGDEYRADIVITAISRLHHPSYPDIPGLERFSGAVMHSARWNHDVEVDGKRIGIIGTGSTSTQILCALVPSAQRISLFQRTPQWVIPIPNSPIPLWKQLALRLPFAGRLYYKLLDRQFVKRSESIVALTREGRAPRRVAAHNALNLIRDSELRRKLTPDYEPSCKRMVISDKFHAAVQQSNVNLVTDAIDHVEPDSIMTRDGTSHPLDVIVLATGFETMKYMADIDVVGRDEMRLQDYWSQMFINYRTVAVPYLPNFFMIGGPYGPLGSAPVPTVSEIQMNYIIQLIDKIINERIALEPAQEWAMRWTQDVRSTAKKSVWASGCRSYYLDKSGVPTISAQSVPQVRTDLKSANFAHYITNPLSEGPWVSDE